MLKVRPSPISFKVFAYLDFNSCNIVFIHIYFYIVPTFLDLRLYKLSQHMLVSEG